VGFCGEATVWDYKLAVTYLTYLRDGAYHFSVLATELLEAR